MKRIRVETDGAGISLDWEANPNGPQYLEMHFQAVEPVAPGAPWEVLDAEMVKIAECPTLEMAELVAEALDQFAAKRQEVTMTENDPQD